MKRLYLIGTAILIFLFTITVYIYTSMYGREYTVEGLIEEIKETYPRIIDVYSNDVKNGTRISSLYTCRDLGISPHIAWKNVPDEAQSLLLIMYDPDAPNGYFIHWVVYDIPSEASEMPRGASPHEIGSAPLLVGKEGLNSRGKTVYFGPCPPQKEIHRYIIMIIALDSYPDYDGTPTSIDLLEYALDHAIGYGTLMFYYG